MKRSTMILLLLCFVTTQILTVTSIKRDFEFFFLVQHWPGANDGDKPQSSSSQGKPSTSSQGKPGTSSKGKPSTSSQGKPSTSSQGKQGTSGQAKPGSQGKQIYQKKTTTKAQPPEERFAIHGLWPEYEDGTYPLYCDPQNRHPFDVSQIEDRTQLQMHWHSLASPNMDGEETWEEEWVKHGTCSLSSLDQRGYFEAALRLKNRANILQILRDAEVIPRVKPPYTLEQITTPLFSVMQSFPIIQCNSKGELYQVYFCVNKTGSNFILCPEAVNTWARNCHDTQKIIFPSFGVHRYAHEEL